MDQALSILMPQFVYCLRILIAGLLGTAVGLERKHQRKAAGARTHTIVALSSAMIMVISKYGFSDVADYDAARIAAQVVSGIGFLGAGIIFVRNRSINGLTTAAGIWATAGIGLAMGAGLWVVALFGTLAILIIQYTYRRIGFLKRKFTFEKLSIVLKNEKGALEKVEEWICSKNVEIDSLRVQKQGDCLNLDLLLFIPEEEEQSGFVSELIDLPQVLSVSGET